MAAFDVTRWIEPLFTDDEGNEPGYDPVHLGGVVLITLTAIGCLYWLLWTLLVFEGRLGNFVALLLCAAVVFALRRLDALPPPRFSSTPRLR